MQPAGQDPEARLVSGTVTLPLRSRPNASPFWIMLLLVFGKLDNGMIRVWPLELADTATSQPISSLPVTSRPIVVI